MFRSVARRPATEGGLEERLLFSQVDLKQRPDEVGECDRVLRCLGLFDPAPAQAHQNAHVVRHSRVDSVKLFRGDFFLCFLG